MEVRFPVTQQSNLVSKPPVDLPFVPSTQGMEHYRNRVVLRTLEAAAYGF